jgi:hypothetical protein
MEGPYAVEVRMDSSGMLKLRALNRNAREIEVAVDEGPASALIWIP